MEYEAWYDQRCIQEMERNLHLPGFKRSKFLFDQALILSRSLWKDKGIIFSLHLSIQKSFISIVARGVRQLHM